MDSTLLHPDGPAEANRLVQVDEAQECCNSAWEDAYSRFETPEQEIAKFARRLHALGADGWRKDSRIVELFCGRGNGLKALSGLGFTEVEGADLSATLLARYEGPARLYVCDCRQLPFEDRSKEILIVQGGLHHLPDLPGDLERSIAEARRVLVDGGLFVAVEPWLTPFLSFVHGVCRNRLARGLSPKVDALAEMIRNEQRTYDQWLGQPRAILGILDSAFERVQALRAWGKLSYIGRRRSDS